MPELSRFFGIIIAMYYRDHPPAHFHAIYGSSEALIQIDPIGLLRGSLPPRALSLVIEWAALHQAELMENWRLVQTAQSPRKIAPLQ